MQVLLILDIYTYIHTNKQTNLSNSSNSHKSPSIFHLPTHHPPPITHQQITSPLSLPPQMHPHFFISSHLVSSLLIQLTSSHPPNPNTSPYQIPISKSPRESNQAFPNLNLNLNIHPKPEALSPKPDARSRTAIDADAASQLSQ